MITRRSAIRLAGGAVLAPAVRGRASAQDSPIWPSRLVRLVVPFPPGGAVDAVGRIIANRASEIWGQQVVIENKSGGGTNIAAEAVAKSEADGYTLYVTSLPHAVNRYLFPSLRYDPVADFAPVTLACLYPNLMVVPNSLPVSSVEEFIAYAKTHRVTFASSGHGTSVHLSGELFKRMTGIAMTHVPYRGASLALNDLIPGRVDVMFNTITSVLAQVRSGQLRGLAVTSARRVPIAADLPTLQEAGVPGFDVSSWIAFFLPARTRPEIIRSINAGLVGALADPKVRLKLEELGNSVVASNPQELGRFLQREMEKWGPVIRDAGISIRE
jgi:tripartite-type tricarboxylate transporter receptor subunit TctC